MTGCQLSRELKHCLLRSIRRTKIEINIRVHHMPYKRGKICWSQIMMWKMEIKSDNTIGVFLLILIHSLFILIHQLSCWCTWRAGDNLKLCLKGNKFSIIVNERMLPIVLWVTDLYAHYISFDAHRPHNGIGYPFDWTLYRLPEDPLKFTSTQTITNIQFGE